MMTLKKTIVIGDDFALVVRYSRSIMGSAFAGSVRDSVGAAYAFTVVIDTVLKSVTYSLARASTALMTGGSAKGYVYETNGGNARSTTFALACAIEERPGT